MATIKSFTSLEQSKKLAEILPIDSADMYYAKLWESSNEYTAMFKRPSCKYTIEDGDIPCWSLASLLSILPKGYSLGRRINGKYYVCMTHIKHNISEFDNPVDACCSMIIKLHELNLL